MRVRGGEIGRGEGGGRGCVLVGERGESGENGERGCVLEGGLCRAIGWVEQGDAIEEAIRCTR